MKRSPLKRKTPLRKQSKRRKEESKEYMRKREIFLAANPICQLWLAENHWNPIRNMDNTYSPIFPGFCALRFSAFEMNASGAPRSTEIHHKNGRNGKNYLDESTWMALSHEAHMRIEKNKSWARANGYLWKK